MSATYPTEPARQLLHAHAARHDVPLTEVGDVLGLPRRTLYRALTGPRLRWDAADRIAIALGKHPSELWPTWFEPVTTATSITPTATRTRRTSHRGTR